MTDGREVLTVAAAVAGGGVIVAQAMLLRATSQLYRHLLDVLTAYHQQETRVLAEALGEARRERDACLAGQQQEEGPE